MSSCRWYLGVLCGAKATADFISSPFSGGEIASVASAAAPPGAALQRAVLELDSPHSRVKAATLTRTASSHLSGMTQFHSVAPVVGHCTVAFQHGFNFVC